MKTPIYSRFPDCCARNGMSSACVDLMCGIEALSTPDNARLACYGELDTYYHCLTRTSQTGWNKKNVTSQLALNSILS